MPSKYLYNPGLRIIELYHEGDISIEEEIEVMQAYMSDKKTDNAFGILEYYNISSMIKWNTEDTRKFRIEILKFKEKINKLKLATACESELIYGMHRLYQAESQDKVYKEFKVFRKIINACEWYKIEADKIMMKEILEHA